MRMSVQRCHGVIHDHLSDRSWIDTVAMALKYLSADLILDVFDLLAERWLREKKPFGRTREVPGFRYRDDVFQIRDAHIGGDSAAGDVVGAAGKTGALDANRCSLASNGINLPLRRPLSC